MIWQCKTKCWNGIIGFLQEGSCGTLNRIQSLLIGILCLVQAGVTVCAYSILLRKSDIGTKVSTFYFAVWITKHSSYYKHNLLQMF